jgi:hypothetical protein
MQPNGGEAASGRTDGDPRTVGSAAGASSDGPGAGTEHEDHDRRPVDSNEGGERTIVAGAQTVDGIAATMPGQPLHTNVGPIATRAKPGRAGQRGETQAIHDRRGVQAPPCQDQVRQGESLKH